MRPKIVPIIFETGYMKDVVLNEIKNKAEPNWQFRDGELRILDSVQPYVSFIFTTYDAYYKFHTFAGYHCIQTIHFLKHVDTTDSLIEGIKNIMEALSKEVKDGDHT